MSLTIREKNQFFAALNSLRDSDRVHKKDLKIFSKMLDKIEGVANGKELLASMNDQMCNTFDINDSVNVKSFIECLKAKLEKQESKIHDKKFKQLENIGGRIFQASQKIEVDQLGKDVKNLVTDIKSRMNDTKYQLAMADIKLREYIITRNKKNALIDAESNKCNMLKRFTPQEFLKFQEQRVKSVAKEVDSFLKEQDDKLKTSKTELAKHEKNLFLFLDEHGQNEVKEDLVKAKNNILLKNEMATREYAGKKFGTVTITNEGRRNFADKIKQNKLSNEGTKFFDFIKKYHDLENKVQTIRGDINLMKSQRDKAITAIKVEGCLQMQSECETQIAKHRDDNNKLDNTKKEMLSELANEIKVIKNKINRAAEINDKIVEKVEFMDEPAIKQSAARHKTGISNLVKEKDELETGYKQLLNV